MCYGPTENNLFLRYIALYTHPKMTSVIILYSEDTTSLTNFVRSHLETSDTHAVYTPLEQSKIYPFPLVKGSYVTHRLRSIYRYRFPRDELAKKVIPDKINVFWNVKSHEIFDILCYLFDACLLVRYLSKVDLQEMTNSYSHFWMSSRSGGPVNRVKPHFIVTDRTQQQIELRRSGYPSYLYMGDFYRSSYIVVEQDIFETASAKGEEDYFRYLLSREPIGWFNVEELLYHCAAGGQADNLRELLNHHAHVKAICPITKGIALGLAVKRGRIDLVRLLIASGADPNQPDLRGKTPLHLVAGSAGRVPIAKLLVEAGAFKSVLMYDNFGFRPIDYARKNSMKSYITRLTRYIHLILRLDTSFCAALLVLLE